jgi:hypothetical protein
MTLVAAFRCRKNGILLCSDREEDDGYSKREVEKIYRIPQLKACEVFIAGAGPSGIIAKACSEIHRALLAADEQGRNLLGEHQAIFEAQLRFVRKEYASHIKTWDMHLLIVFAPREEGLIPVLYRTEQEMVVEATHYAAFGSGKPISDYLAARLYEYGRLESRAMGILAAFILREAQDSSCGVGLGTDMVFIHEGSKRLYFIPPAKTKELEACIPALGVCVHGFWPENVVVPEWYRDW